MDGWMDGFTAPTWHTPAMATLQGTYHVPISFPNLDY
jgi:hypothetical protein